MGIDKGDGADLHVAARFGDLSVVQSILSSDPLTVNSRDRHSCTLDVKQDFSDVDGEPASRGSLGYWLPHLQQAGEAWEALDKSILGEEGKEDEMLMAVRIVVVCLSELPADRPLCDEFVPMPSQLHSF